MMRYFRTWGALSAACLIGAIGLVTGADALLTGGPDIIPAPASVKNSNVSDVPPGATNNHQQAFDERQFVVLPAALAVDGGSIAAGTVVDSHMIFLNVPDGTPGTTTDCGRVWTFLTPILGVMSDQAGNLEANSSALLGAPGTSYPAAFASRGLESNDHLGTCSFGRDGYQIISANQIRVGMNVSQPGDWIRVVTRSLTKDDCKGNGWRDLKDAAGNPLFANQGDCVSYVATEGRNPPKGQ